MPCADCSKPMAELGPWGDESPTKVGNDRPFRAEHLQVIVCAAARGIAGCRTHRDLPGVSRRDAGDSEVHAS